MIVVGINVDTDPRKVKAFLKQTPLPFDVVLDTDSAIHKQFDATSVPATYWINTKGQIERKTVGYDERKKKELDKYVQSLLKIVDFLFFAKRIAKTPKLFTKTSLSKILGDTSDRQFNNRSFSFMSIRNTNPKEIPPELLELYAKTILTTSLQRQFCLIWKSRPFI